MKACVLACRERIEIPAHFIHRARDFERAAILGSFEKHVLEKMRDAGFARMLVTSADFDPNADRETLKFGMALCQTESGRF